MVIFSMTDERNGSLGNLNPVLIGICVIVIGLSFGITSGLETFNAYFYLNSFPAARGHLRRRAAVLRGRRTHSALGNLGDALDIMLIFEILIQVSDKSCSRFWS